MSARVIGGGQIGREKEREKQRERERERMLRTNLLNVLIRVITWSNALSMGVCQMHVRLCKHKQQLHMNYGDEITRYWGGGYIE